MSRAELEALMARFRDDALAILVDSADEDEDGFLTADESAASFGIDAARFAALDADGDGLHSVAEVLYCF